MLRLKHWMAALAVLTLLSMLSFSAFAQGAPKVLNTSWQAEHETYRSALGGEREHRPRIRREIGPRDSGHRRRQLAVGIADRNPDGLAAEIEPNQCAARWQVAGGFNERQDESGHCRGLARVLPRDITIFKTRDAALTWRRV